MLQQRHDNRTGVKAVIIRIILQKKDAFLLGDYTGEKKKEKKLNRCIHVLTVLEAVRTRVSDTRVIRIIIFFFFRSYKRTAVCNYYIVL